MENWIGVAKNRNSSSLRKLDYSSVFKALFKVSKKIWINLVTRP